MPGVKYFVHPYELFPRAALGALAASGARKGALLRVNWLDGPGYADLHPWPELGDPSLEEQLKILAQGGRTRLLSRALLISREDARARAAGRSLFHGLRIPENHFLVTDPRSLTDKLLEEILARGFKRAKLKIGGDPAAQAKTLLALNGLLPNELERFWRLDFNASFREGAVRDFIRIIGAARSRIDFLEDPLPWDPETWAILRQDHGIRLASDREKPKDAPGESQNEIWPECADFRVVKPAVDDPERIPSDLPRIFTSYLDHPLGQAAAALEAARDGTREICGLLSQHAYQPSPFSEALRSEGPDFVIPEGTGLGFDPLLGALEWKPLP